ncbi:XRE family transcriptional regulator [Anaerosporomusa subterranea]|uniref:XRE family transcriptional regulator n=1 Tax=Anaerosporomusa subterranea TaxID=1794912 RepID=A0A154BQ87_ANASB|nr:helix-turn-helix transcriptional regulator [Anaerosporomusa subterranea]KYZ76081.1 XRE family transcriptional regulator [Anaerosporomusa subterranea]
METLGDKIKQLRSKLTQEELASILQVDRSTLASWEINRREPDIRTLCRLAALFKVSVDWLVGYTPDPGHSSEAGTGLLQENATHYQTVEDAAWHKVIDTAKYYGLKPDNVLQLIEVNAKIVLAVNPPAKKRTP